MLKDLDYKPIQAEDLEWARLLHNDPEVLSMLTDPHVVSPEEQIQWFSRLQSSKTSFRIVVSEGPNRIGLIRLDNYDTNNNSCCVGLDIHKDFRGKGYAKTIYTDVINDLLGQDFNRVWLLVAGYNTRAIKLYEGLGFKHEGVQREGLFKNGKYHDYLMMSILKSEWSNK